MAMVHDGKDIIDTAYKDLTAEMYAEGHSFFTYISDSADSLASCCRLKNELTENTFNPTSGLTGVMTGSCNVITLNLNRIIQDYFKTVDTNYFGASGTLYKDITEEDMHGFKEYLVDILDRIYKYQIAYNECLKYLKENKLLHVYDAGFIAMKKQYLTNRVNMEKSV